MKGEGIVPIGSKPGIKRDGTNFEGENYTDGQWCRFRRGKPRKIGGYRSVTQSLQGPIRSIDVHSGGGVNRIYLGSSSALEYTDVTADGIGGGVGDRTPATLEMFNDNLWQFDEMYDGGGAISVLLAHAAPNGSLIDSDVQTKVWYGNITASTALADTTAPEVSGGVFCVPPYAFTLDNDGLIAWCVPNTPTDWVAAGSGDARITKSKLVYGASVRGTDTVTFLVWSLDKLVRGTFVGGTSIFDFNELGTISLMSSRSVVEYNGVFYWMGQDRFQMFTGVIQDLPNEFNLDWLMEGEPDDPGINMNQRQKVWGVAIPKYSEIWWFFPRGDATECTHAVIFNVAGGYWYDTEISRLAGCMGSVFRYPLMTPEETSEETYVRVLHGTASASAGVAANAFDNDPATSCNAGANGNIAYDYGQYVTKHIHRVGIRPSAAMTSPAAIEFEYSVDTGTTVSNWTTFHSVPSQTWTASTDYYFDMPAVHTDEVRALRVRATGGATLACEEVYFMGHGHMVFQHEFGYDRIIGSLPVAIPSWFETADVSWAASGPVAGAETWVGRDVQMETVTLEPDFIQVGDMTFSVNARPYPSSTETEILSKDFSPPPDTVKIDMKKQGRIIRFKFISNTQGGFYQMGQPVIKVGEGDVHK